MPASQNFRSAFNGFHREDVVRYLEYINAKHTALTNQLASEAEQLRELLNSRPAQEDLSEALAALTRERDALLAQVEALTARCEELEQLLTEPVPAAPESPAVQPVDVSQELEAYRRAERTERVARERAGQLYNQMNGVLAEATAKADAVAAQVGAAADQVMVQVCQLQSAVTTGKQALQEAAAAMYAIRPQPSEE